MPKYIKVKPVGIDVPIQKQQERLWAALKSKWGLADDAYISYGRCYRNQSPSGYKPQMYVPGTTLGDEYENLFIDDRAAVTTFFGAENETFTNGIMTANVHLIVIVDLTKIGKTTQHRPDAEARMDVFESMKFKPGFEATGVVVGIDKVFAEYTAWRSTTGGVNYTDMHPKHCFRINFQLTYIPQTICIPVFN